MYLINFDIELRIASLNIADDVRESEKCPVLQN